MRRTSPALAATSLVAVLVVVGCAEEDATPIDLDDPATGTAATVEDAGDAGSGAATTGEGRVTPHLIQENAQARAYAEQQCLDDPTAAEGVIRIVDPTNDQVVGEVVVDCAEVREAQPGSP